MAVTDRPVSHHFLVLFLLLSSSLVRVRGVREFLGTCEFTINLMQTNVQSGILRMPLPESFDRYQDPNRNIHCDIVITFTSGMNLLIELYYLDIMPKSNNVAACGTGLEVFDNTGRNYYGGRVCMEGWRWEEKHRESQQEKKVVQNSPLTFRLVSEGPYTGYGFKVHFNQFRPYWPCYTREFKCEQIQHCVHDDLTCDGWDDCGDDSDEREEAGCDLLTPSEICALIIGILFLLGTTLATVLFILAYKRNYEEHGVRSESKMPIVNDRYSMDPVLNFPRRYNSQESMSKYSRATGPTMNRDSDSETIDKVDLEKADRYSNKDNMSERSYRSNPRRNKLLSSEASEPIKKTGQYSYKGHSSSQSSLTRDKGENGIDNAGMRSKTGSRDRLSEKDRRDRDDYSDSEEDRERYKDRKRRKSKERDRKGDFSDEDSDVDRSGRRRSGSDENSDSEFEAYLEWRRRRRRSKERRSREREDSDADRPSRRRDSRERERNRDSYNEDRDLKKSPDLEDDDRRDRRRRQSNERKRSPDDDDDDDRPPRRRGRSGERRRPPGSEKDDVFAPPKYEDVASSEDNAHDMSKSSGASLPPPPSGEDIRRMEMQNRKSPPRETNKSPPPPVEDNRRARAPPKVADKPAKVVDKPAPPPSGEEVRRRDMENQRGPPVDYYRPAAPPSGEEIRRREMETQRAAPKVASRPPPPSAADPRRREPETRKPPREISAEEEGARRRSRDDRRERYSKNRWTPKSTGDSPPPEYEDMAPGSVFIKAGYKEEAV